MGMKPAELWSRFDWQGGNCFRCERTGLPVTKIGEIEVAGTAFPHGGRALAGAARTGNLRLGLRGILARHILFHWNRMGLTTRQQDIYSVAARETILGG